MACGDPEIRCQRQIIAQLDQQKKELLDQYACYDGYQYYKGTCGPPKKITDYQITDHPNIQDYVKKSEVNRQIQLEKYNYPITQHPDYPRVKVYFKQLLDAKLAEIQRQRYPIQNHPDYQKLMNKYACQTTSSNGEAKYQPCRSCETSVSSTTELIPLQLVETTPVVNCQPADRQPPANPVIIRSDEYNELQDQIRQLRLQANQASRSNQTVLVEPIFPPSPMIPIPPPPVVDVGVDFGVGADIGVALPPPQIQSKRCHGREPANRLNSHLISSNYHNNLLSNLTNNDQSGLYNSSLVNQATNRSWTRDSNQDWLNQNTRIDNQLTPY